MTSMKDMKAYLKRAAEKKAKLSVAEGNGADTEVGVIKEAKKVVHKTVLEGHSGPIAAPPLNVVPHPKGELGASESRPARTRKQQQAFLEDTAASKKARVDEGIVSWSDTLTEFVGEGAVQSLWDTRFPTGTFVADHVWTEDDRDRVVSVGPEQALLAMQSYGLKVASISRSFGDEFNKLRNQERVAKKALADARKVIADQPNLSKENTELKAEVERLKKAANDREEAQRAKEEALKKTYDATIADWTSKIQVVRDELKATNSSLASKDKVIDELKEQAADFMLTGFDKAKAQVEALFPDLDLSSLSVLKTVVNGQLVEEEEEEVHDGEAQVGETIGTSAGPVNNVAESVMPV